ncbi:hypothetical protein GCM10010435_67290 [Winogradskya consettensis]
MIEDAAMPRIGGVERPDEPAVSRRVVDRNAQIAGAAHHVVVQPTIGETEPGIASRVIYPNRTFTFYGHQRFVLIFQALKYFRYNIGNLARSSRVNPVTVNTNTEKHYRPL